MTSVSLITKRTIKLPTIYDVAKLAGVSPKTVSRALNGDAPVAESTLTKVQAAIKSLGYVPSRAAQSMRSNKSGLVGLITGAISVSTSNSQGPAGLPDLYIVQGIQKAFQDSGYTLMIADTGNDQARIPNLIDTFVNHRAEGLIITAEFLQQIAIPTSVKQPPTILVNCFDALQTACVIPNDYEGEYKLVERLITEGHSRIAYLTLSGSLHATAERTLGYRDALLKAGIEFDPRLLLQGEDPYEANDENITSTALESLLSLDEPPTVICCGNDKLAMRCYGMLRARGVKIPGDMSIAGYDDYLSISTMLFPPLTTVELPYFRMGETAAKGLIEKIKTPESDLPTCTKVSGSIIWRSSVNAVKNKQNGETTC